MDIYYYLSYYSLYFCICLKFWFLKKWCWKEENSFPWWIWALNRDMNKTTVEQKRKKKKTDKFLWFHLSVTSSYFDCLFHSLNILNLFKNCILFLITIINLTFGSLRLLCCFGDLTSLKPHLFLKITSSGKEVRIIPVYRKILKTK